MANSNFVVHNGLTVGPLTIDATTGAINTSGTITSTGGGYLNGALGANTPNTVVATSVTTSSGGQHVGYHTGAIGANTANTGAFTTITSTETIIASGNIVAASGIDSTSNTTGALVVTGGAGVSGNLFVGGNLSVAGNSFFVNTTTITTTDTIAAPTLNAGVIGNTNAAHYGSTFGATSGFLPTANNTVSVANATNYMSSVYATNYFAANSFVPIANNTVDIGSVNLYMEGIFTVNSTIANSIVPTANGVASIGSVDKQFNNIYGINFLGTSTTAKYADLAERYRSDADYEPGTVVDFGGDAEITLSTIDGSQYVAGVISTNPAYLMNDNDPSMLPVALMGRVPCKVTGPIQKGSMLVSNGDGSARMERYPVIGSVLGKALESHGDGVGVIEVVVGRL